MVLAIDAAKAKLDRRLIFEARAFTFVGKLRARHHGLDPVRAIKAGSESVRDDDKATRQRW